MDMRCAEDRVSLNGIFVSVASAVIAQDAELWPVGHDRWGQNCDKNHRKILCDRMILTNMDFELSAACSYQVVLLREVAIVHARD